MVRALGGPALPRINQPNSFVRAPGVCHTSATNHFIFNICAFRIQYLLMPWGRRARCGGLWAVTEQRIPGEHHHWGLREHQAQGCRQHPVYRQHFEDATTIRFNDAKETVVSGNIASTTADARSPTGHVSTRALTIASSQSRNVFSARRFGRMPPTAVAS